MSEAPKRRHGPPRLPTEQRSVRISMTIYPQQLAALDALRGKMPRSEMLRVALEAYLAVRQKARRRYRRPEH